MLRKLSILLITLFTLSVSTHPVLAEGYLKYQSAPDLKQSFMELGDVYAPAFTRTIDLYSTIGHQTLSYGEKMFELLDLSGRSILDAHNHVIGKTGEAIGGVVAGVTGEVDALNSKLIKGAKNIEKSKTFVTQDRRSTASIGTIWNSFIDTISNPLVPIFYQAPSTASTSNKNKTNPQTLIVSNPSPSNHSEAVANVIERITAPGVTRAELASSLNALRLELLALNASTRSFASEAAAHASGNSSYSVYQAVSTSGSSNSVSSQWTTSGADISYSLGKVGIGTSNPSATLSVVDKTGGMGSINIETYGDGGIFGTPHSNLTMISARGSFDSPSNLLAGDDVGMLNFYGQTTSGQELAAAIGATASLDFSGSNVPTDLYFITNKSEKLRITSAGNVGIGTTTPWAKLAVSGQAVADYFTAVSTSATSTFAGGFSANGGAIVSDFSTGVTSISNLSFGAQSFDADSGMLSWIDMPVTSSASAGTVESYTAQIDGNPLLTIYSESDGAGGIQNQRIGIGTSSPYLGPLTMASGAYVTTGGTWTNASDRNLKENFTEIDDQEILNKISSLPITRWNYKTEATSTMHIGPMAQDFFATFGLGGSDKSISTIDPAGIALSAIKALNLNLNAIASSTASTTPASLSFASGFFSTVYSHISTWLSSATNGIANIFSNKVTTNELCVGSTCVTETQLKALLEKAGQPVTTYGPTDSNSTSSTTADTQTSTTTPTDTSDSSAVDTSTSTSTTSPDTSGGDIGAQSDTPAVEVAPDPTPSPDPAPAPTPEPSPAP